MGTILVFLALTAATNAAGIISSPRQDGRGAAPPADQQSPAPGKPSSGRDTPPIPWWAEPATVKELGLSPSQVTKITKVVDERSREAEPFRQELERQQVVLERIATDRKSTELAFRVQLRVVEGLESQLRQDRALLLFRLHRILTADQLKKLGEIRARPSSGRRGGTH
jgi:Spy/CpxP family protein refolding chaperone